VWGSEEQIEEERERREEKKVIAKTKKIQQAFERTENEHAKQFV
jgi:hypothetical protein